MAGSYRADDDDLAPVEGARILVVESHFNEDIVELLHEGAVHALEELGADVTTITVPGALELAAGRGDRARRRRGRPARLMRAWSRSAASFAATHIISRSSPMRARARSPISRSRAGCRSAMECLTVDNEEQAVVRADPKQGGADKGGDAALAALALVRLKRKLGGRA